MRDDLSKTQVKQGYGAYAYAGNIAWQTATIDTRGYDSLYFCLSIGAVVDADATFTTLVQESDDDTTYTDVADADMVSQTPGTAPEAAASFQFDDDWEVRTIAYIGSKRYVKLYVTGASNTGLAYLSITAHLGRGAYGGSAVTKPQS